ncbi:PREDICTED: putative nuclease HARBI1 [Rhagoletis zephyria]|uniref:putative nuclease HARBI1 n=1 Tax=Rhagoletis zephyria TaxID=28612 RepID=UPI000811957D|nr:PREDICTED: putative nuclease HARBI1 [Rhagoletis zephyria]
MCRLKTNLEATKHVHKGVLLGDGGYPASSIMLTPVRDPTTEKEQRYNRSHITTRTKIECLNGEIKSKFQSVLERIRVDLDTVKNIIFAVAVLHNIAKERNMQFLDAVPRNGTLSLAQNLSVDIPESVSGRAFKTAFINNHF